MQVNSATSGSNTQNSSDSTVPLPTQMLSQQDFLNLLVTQMTAQDPLKPIDNQDMLSQMVQFSTLNANTTMQSALGQMQTGQVFSQATALLGREVKLQVDSSTTAQGVVTGVDTSGSVPQITVNGQSYTLDQVLSVTNAPTTP
ncbi:MAG TPA: flagellar hook capping FlgD N-terminal domain-containing protein [Verrucomicrobiae bacterium]|jgi:flagellar basal-body rod modification protein FlgD|nr:flagellar hook capping FlgD N-terminal domain-containing protein [Verrucomicrobiae bacterium]